jgi:deoxyribodipyrimidine photo-lyase
METSKPHINIVWFKRNLRLQDNEAIVNALSKNIPVVFLFVFEKSLQADPHYSERHWNFIKESIVDINSQLAAYDTKVMVANCEVINVINVLQEYYMIDAIFSHQETGIKATYKRDLNFKRFCKNNQINWIENINNGIQRGLKDRSNWLAKFENYINETQFEFSPSGCNFVNIETIKKLESNFNTISLITPDETKFQRGGSSIANRYLKSFFEGRYLNYNNHISKPLLSRKSCSRLSPYIAWGNLSTRQVIQAAHAFRETCKYKKQIDSFISRLTWQAHFIQKFEMEDIMEFESINSGYREINKKVKPQYIEAWEKGQTGYPLIDACMRCLNETGFLNFRMRALLVSFFTHNLWQPWQEATHHLSRQFLDFEPGIHFPQLQMQAGETGVNLLRIYNPVKNSLEHDPAAEFIVTWVPELKNLPLNFIHEPYKMTYLDQKFNSFTLGIDYPKPIVNMEKTRKFAADYLWKMKTNPIVKEEGLRILKIHSLSLSENMA